MNLCFSSFTFIILCSSFFRVMLLIFYFSSKFKRAYFIWFSSSEDNDLMDWTDYLVFFSIFIEFFPFPSSFEMLTLIMAFYDEAYRSRFYTLKWFLFLSSFENSYWFMLWLDCKELLGCKKVLMLLALLLELSTILD